MPRMRIDESVYDMLPTRSLLFYRQWSWTFITVTNCWKVCGTWWQWMKVRDSDGKTKLSEATLIDTYSLVKSGHTYLIFHLISSQSYKTSRQQLTNDCLAKTHYFSFSACYSICPANSQYQLYLVPICQLLTIPPRLESKIWIAVWWHIRIRYNATPTVMQLCYK